jgi:ABC-type nitrate/sulfonate/bicarbonate transport system substrate-binding protein
MFGRASILLWTGLSLMATAHAETALRVIVFPGGANLPLWVAQEQGFYARHGVAVQLTPTPNSVTLVRSLMDGSQEIALSTFDNIVAYQEGQGEVTLSAAPDFFAFMGFSLGTVRLVVQPEIRDYADLRGKVLAVDAKATGYSLVLQKLLQLRGLKEGDYTLQTVGGTATRAQQLMENKFAGTILTTPLELVPESRGYRRLANAEDAVGRYQTIVGMARHSWAAANREALIGFIRGSIAGLDWLFEPTHRTAAEAIYRKYQPNVPAAAVPRHVEALVGEREGFTRGGQLDPAGIRTVLAIRSEFGRPQRTLDDLARYVDERYFRAATNR